MSFITSTKVAQFYNFSNLHPLVENILLTTIKLNGISLPNIDYKERRSLKNRLRLSLYNLSKHLLKFSWHLYI